MNGAGVEVVLEVGGEEGGAFVAVGGVVGEAFLADGGEVSRDGGVEGVGGGRGAFAELLVGFGRGGTGGGGLAGEEFVEDGA